MTHTRFNRLDNCNYSLGAEGDIVVEDKESSAQGVFDEYGAYKRGELKQADLQMCQFIAKLGLHRPNG